VGCPVAYVGRKNYLFAGSEKGARRIAVIYSLFESSKMHNVNSYEWLKDVLGRIQEYPIHRVADLLRQNWIKIQA